MNHRDAVHDDDDSKETEPPKQRKGDNGEAPRESTKAIDTANDDRKSSNIEPTESTQSIQNDSDHHQSNDDQESLRNTNESSHSTCCVDFDRDYDHNETMQIDECQSLELRQLQLIQKVNTMQKRMDSMARSVGTSLDTIRSLEKYYHSEDVMANVTADDVQCVMENVNESISCLFYIAADIKMTADRYNVRLPDEQNIESLLSSLRETESTMELKEESEDLKDIKKDRDIVVDNELKPRKSKGPKVDPLLCRMDDALRMVNDAIEQHKVAVYDFLDEDIRSVTALFSEVKEQLTAS